MSASTRVVVVGGGQAAAQLIGSLRGHGFGGQITLFSDEQMLPYHRPPLSKKFLLGELSQDKLLIRKPAYYEGHGVDVRLGCPVLGVDAAARQLTVAEHPNIDYDVLVLATGGRARRLPLLPQGMSGVHALRTYTDALALRDRLHAGARVVLIGGGYIGLEVAASLRTLGCEVTVLEMQSRVLERSAAPAIAQRLVEEHAHHGSRVHCGIGVSRILGEHAFEGVLTSDGQTIEADVLVVGIGMQANTSLAEQAGLACADGILVDRSGRTSDPSIYAIGDVACWRDRDGQGSGRLESVDNAIFSANVAAAAIAGGAPPEAAPPWFWSDQYHNKLQMVGLAPAQASWLQRRSEDGARLSCFCIEDERLRAAQCLNAAGDFIVAKRLIATGQRIDPAALTNPSIALRDLCTTASE